MYDSPGARANTKNFYDFQKISKSRKILKYRAGPGTTEFRGAKKGERKVKSGGGISMDIMRNRPTTPPAPERIQKFLTIFEIFLSPEKF